MKEELARLELLINFRERIYSGNGRLLQGDIYRSWVDGRAAWREIKSDCLGKSEPPLPSEPPRTTPWCPRRATFSPGCRAAYQPRNEEHEEHTYRGISGPLSSPRLSFSTGPSRGGEGRHDESIASILPNSDKPAQCVIRPLEINCVLEHERNLPAYFHRPLTQRITGNRSYSDNSAGMAGRTGLISNQEFRSGAVRFYGRKDCSRRGWPG